MQRETREEAGIEIDPTSLIYLNSVAFIRPDGIPVILLKFAARYVSGDVVLEAGGFTDHAWVTATESRQYECIEGIWEELDALAEHAGLQRS